MNHQSAFLRRVGVSLVLIVILLASWLRVSAASPVVEFNAARTNSLPAGITLGPDGNVWYTEYIMGRIGRMTTNGATVDFPVPNTNSLPLILVTGPDGNLWFTEAATNVIGRMTTNGAVTEFIVPTTNCQPFGITVGSDGNLWFTEVASNKVGRITTNGVVTEFNVTTNSQPYLITSGPDGSLWFTENVAGRIGRMTTGGSLVEFQLATNCTPYGIASGPDGALWFMEETSNKLGRITTSGVLTEYFVPSPGATPAGIVTGPDNNLWFCEASGSAGKVARFNPVALAFTEYPVPTTNGQPFLITMGGDTNLWFTELNGAKIGRINPDRALTASAASLSITEGLFNGVVGTFHDPDPNPGTSNQYSATIDWGDGSPIIVAFVSATGGGNFNVSGSHVYEAGLYHTLISVIDNDTSHDLGGVSVSAIGTVIISDAPLTISGTALTLNEGNAIINGTLAQFTDSNPYASASDFAATIDWGDGTISVGTVTYGIGGFVVEGTHTYTDEGHYTPTVTVSEGGGSLSVVTNGGFESGNLNSWVVDGATNSPDVVFTNSHSGTFCALLGTPSGLPEPFGNSSFYQTITVPPSGAMLNFWEWPSSSDSVIFDWQEVSITDTNGVLLSTLMHVCENNRAWTNKIFDLTPWATKTVRIHFLVHQDGFGDDTAMFVDDVAVRPYGLTTNETSIVDVGDASLTLTPKPIAAIPGVAFNRIVATLSDNYSGATASDFSANIAWGDGSSSVGTIAANGTGGFSTIGSHTYTNAGLYSVTIIVGDDGGSSVTNSTTASVRLDAYEYSLGPGSGGPQELAPGPDGNMWFTDVIANKIGRMNLSSHVVSEFAIPTPNSSPFGIVSGPDGNVWFTEVDSNKVGRITTNGVFLPEFTNGIAAGSGPAVITAGPDGNLWFSEAYSNRIARITTNGVVTTFPVPTPNGEPDGITAGPDGALWFVELGGSKIGRITTNGTVLEFPLPITNAAPIRIITGSDSNLWFTEESSNKIGRITTGGVITQFTIPTDSSAPYGITSGADGNLWFTEILSDQVGRITPQGNITEYAVPTASNVSGIAAGSDGNIWFGEQSADQLGEIILDKSLSSFGTNFTAMQGVSFAGTVATAVDSDPMPGPVSAYAAVIDWADGITSPGTIISNGPGQFTINGSHTYFEAGPHTVAVTFTDHDFSHDSGGRSTTATTIGAVAGSIYGYGGLANNTVPSAITAGADANLWFSESGGTGNIGRLNVITHVITEFGGGTPEYSAEGIAAGPDGNVWFTEFNNGKVGRITTNGAIVEFTAPGTPTGITAGPDGNLWVALFNGNAISRMATNGTFTNFTLPAMFSFPTYIVVGADGNLWFTEGAGRIGQMSTNGVVLNEFVAGITPNSGLNGIAAGPDGNIWFTEVYGAKIGRITTNGIVTEFSVLSTNEQPYAITAGPDGNLWFVDLSFSLANPNAIGRITPSGVVTEFPLATNNPPFSLAAGADGNIYFSELLLNKIGEIVLDKPLSAIGATNSSASVFSGVVASFFDNQPAIFAAVPPQTPAPINGGGTDNSLALVIGVPPDEVATNVTVTLGISHPFDSDLVLKLIAPDGTTVPLANRRGGGGANFTGTIFDDHSAAPIASGVAPFTGSFRPETPLSVLNGKLPNGFWTLQVSNVALADTGTLLNWSLSIGTISTNGTLPPNLSPANYTAVINWGDSTATPGVITLNANGRFDVSGAHTFGGSSNYSVRVTITDTDATRDIGGSSVVANGLISVNAAPPTLSIVLISPGRVVISWPTNATGFTLQSTPSVSPTNWTTVTNIPAIVGSKYNVTNTATTQKFYQLKK